MTFIPNDEDRIWRDEPNHKGWIRLSTLIKYAIVAILLACLIIGLWYFLSPKQQMHTASNLPLIEADQTPYKEKAKDEGVPQILHQDKLIYGRLRDDKNEPPAEHILPDPEEPLKMTEPYVPEEEGPAVVEDEGSGIVEESESANSITDLIDNINEEESPSTTKNPGAQPRENSKDKSRAAEAVNPDGSMAPPDALSEQRAPEMKAPTQKKVDQSVVLRMGGSHRSPDEAKAEWDKVSERNSDLLQGYNHKVDQVDLGKKEGIRYHNRVTGFESPEEARRLTDKLQQRGFDSHAIRKR